MNRLIPGLVSWLRNFFAVGILLALWAFAALGDTAGTVTDAGTRIHFPHVTAADLAGPGHPALEIVFASRFDVKELGLGVNGIAASPHGRLRLAARWSGDGATLQVALGDLRFGGRRHFARALARLQADGGSLTFWVSAPARALGAALRFHINGKERREREGGSGRGDSDDDHAHQKNGGGGTVVITGAVPAGAFTASPSLSLAFRASGPAECSLDGGSYRECASPVSFATLPEGDHTAAIRSRKNRSDRPALYFWTVDRTPPSLDLGDVPPVLSDSPDASFTFAADEPAEFRCAIDDGAPGACTSPFSPGGLEDGAHSLVVKAVDRAGNESLPAIYRWAIDTSSRVTPDPAPPGDVTPPEIVLGAASPPDSVTTAPSLALAFFVSEAASVTCELDDGGAAPCASPYLVNDLAVGPHTVVLVAVDEAGNISAPVSYRWDVIAPFVSGNVSVSQVTGTSAVLTWQTSLPGTSEAQYGTGPLTLTASGSPTPVVAHQVVIGNLTPGTSYTASGKSVAADGRVSLTAPVTFFTSF